MQGWIKLHRQIADNDLWLDKPFSKGQAWVDLLLITNHAKGLVKVKNGLTFPVERGECGYSVLALADRWGWSRGKVDRFLLSLEGQKMIQIMDTKTDSKTDALNRNIIKVLRYEEYQQTDSKTDTKTDTKRTLNGHKQECKNDKKNNIPLSFDEFWQMYPIKQGKKKAQDKYNKALSKVEHNQIMQGLNSYLEYIKSNKVEGKFIKHPETWLNGECWNDKYTTTNKSSGIF